MSEKNTATTNETEYKALKHDFLDRFKGQDVEFSFRFKRPTTPQSNRVQKTALKNAGQAFKNLILETVHRKTRPSFRPPWTNIPDWPAPSAVRLWVRAGSVTWKLIQRSLRELEGDGLDSMRRLSATGCIRNRPLALRCL